MTCQEHLLSKVVLTVGPLATPCWIWQAGLDEDGYGRAYWGRVKFRAHRLSYQVFCAEIPEGLVIDHLCRQRNCINPLHLEPVTNRENIVRGCGPEVAGARMRAKTHCPRGHEYTSGNTRIHTITGSRQCKECSRLSGIKSRNRKAVANGCAA